MVRAGRDGGNNGLIGHKPGTNVFSDSGLPLPAGAFRVALVSPQKSASSDCAGPADPSRSPPMKRLIAPSLLIILGGMAAARDPGPDTQAGKDAVAKLTNKLGESEVAIDEVRVTKDDVVCIDFHGTGSTSGKKAHAVVMGEKMLISTNSDKNGFQDAWDQHCLGPRGGATSAQ